MSNTVFTNPGGKVVCSNLQSTIGAAGGVILFTVPTGKRWVVEALSIDITCTATVGNRTFGVWSTDQLGNRAFMGTTSAATTASQVCGIDVFFGGTGAPSTTVRRNIANSGNTNVQVRESIPIKTMRAGQLIALDDYASIDVADAFNAFLQYTEYDV